MGAPMLISFYSVWLFEVGYGLAQCVLSVIFVSVVEGWLCVGDISM